ncbi:hypothetical protein [Bradyrhizobium ivorense]|uniref:hypothetical protein n=1 Tax=Bradyrhizobium ivorense TaxID=2511166 RepID=UPI0011173E69|nr:hypothetical protein [Bradyrhizobium ivorense]
MTDIIPRLVSLSKTPPADTGNSGRTIAEQTVHYTDATTLSVKLSASLYDHGEDGGHDYWVWVQLPGKKKKTAFDDSRCPIFSSKQGVLLIGMRTSANPR